MSAKAWTDSEIVEHASGFFASIEGDQRALVAVVGDRAVIIVEKRENIEWLRDVCSGVLAALPAPAPDALREVDHG